jgi:hypothetical protein
MLELTMLKWSDLSTEQKCVLVEAAKSGLLQNVLAAWAPTEDWAGRLAYAPSLAQAIIDLTAAGLVEVYRSESLQDEGELIFLEDLPAILQDLANWMTDDGPKALIELASTSTADEVFNSRGDEGLYDYRRRN